MLQWITAGALFLVCSSSLLSTNKSYQPPCRTADSTSSDMQHLYRLIAVQTDSLSTSDRQQAALPANIDSTTVQLVSDSTTCRLAFNAYSSVVHTPPTVQPIDLIRFGNRYVVTDHVLRAGEWAAHITFDSTFSSTLAKKAR